MPSERSARRHSGLDLEQPSPADLLGLSCAPPRLLIGEAAPHPAELLAQSSVFFLEIVNRVRLAPIDPATEDQHQKMKPRNVHLLPYQASEYERKRPKPQIRPPPKKLGAGRAGPAFCTTDTRRSDNQAPRAPSRILSRRHSVHTDRRTSAPADPARSGALLPRLRPLRIRRGRASRRHEIAHGHSAGCCGAGSR